MKLDRNLNHNGKGKYAAINLRKLDGPIQSTADLIEALKKNPDAVEWGCVGARDEFFLIKLKDLNAEAALTAYAAKAEGTDPEYAAHVTELAMRAGPNSPYCAAPD